jgi:hypothetical protein
MARIVVVYGNAHAFLSEQAHQMLEHLKVAGRFGTFNNDPARVNFRNRASSKRSAGAPGTALLASALSQCASLSLGQFHDQRCCSALKLPIIPTLSRLRICCDRYICHA